MEQKNISPSNHRPKRIKTRPSAGQLAFVVLSSAGFNMQKEHRLGSEEITHPKPQRPPKAAKATRRPCGKRTYKPWKKNPITIYKGVPVLERERHNSCARRDSLSLTGPCQKLAYY